MWLAALSRGPLIEEIQAVWVQEIWRYPVKSMAGESLEAADLTEAGVVGDRVVQVRNAAGQNHDSSHTAVTLTPSRHIG